MTTEFESDASDERYNTADQPAIEETESASSSAYRGAASEPLFGLLIGGAISIGLTPLLPENADLRFTLVWGVLALFGILAWLIGNGEWIDQESPENLVWGVVFGLITGTPFLLFGGNLLNDAVRLMFAALPLGTVLAYLIFVMPLAETLFFRGVLQQQYAFGIVGLLATVWALVLFFPVLWADLLASPAVGVTIAVVLLVMNLVYSYVRQRNGLAAAWICQIVVNIVVMFFPLI